MLIVRPLTNEEIESVYKNHMVFDFPDNELKPLDIISSLQTRNIYFAYGLFEKKQLKGYAFFSSAKISHKRRQILLLDYFAIIANGRSRGYGSKFLMLLRAHLPTDFPEVEGIIAEVERMSAASTQDEKTIRERRIAFYRRNGFRRTKIKSLLFGVDFAILFCPFEENLTSAQILDDQYVIAQLRLVYDSMLPRTIREKNVSLWIKTS